MKNGSFSSDAVNGNREPLNADTYIYSSSDIKGFPKKPPLNIFEHI